MTQADLADALGTTQQTISDLKNLSNDSTWEKHWTLFLRLLPYCIQYGLIGRQELLGGKHHERKGSSGNHQAVEVKTGERTKGKNV